jgi:hypothetical protein
MLTTSKLCAKSVMALFTEKIKKILIKIDFFQNFKIFIIEDSFI